MKTIIKIGIVFAFSILMLGCNDSSNPPTKPETPAEPTHPVDCQEFKDFYVVYLAMKSNEALLLKQESTANRLTVASALLAEHLMHSYGPANQLRDHDPATQEIYLKYFNSIFDADGNIRPQPNHPLTTVCSGKA